MRDWSRLKGILANSKIQVENNALWQTIRDLIVAAQGIDTDFVSSDDELRNSVAAIRSANVIEVDTSSIAQTYDLESYVLGNSMYIFKDISGNAGTNNITLTGTVDATVDPVISTNYGIYRVFRGTDNLLYTW